MKFCVIANLRFETPARRDSLDKAVKDKMAGKMTWGQVVRQSFAGEDGLASHSLEVRFENEADRDELFALIKGKMDKIPVLKGTVSKHNCSHDESPPQPCQIIEEISK